MRAFTHSRLGKIVLAGGAVLAIGASSLGFTAYTYFKPTAAASAPIEAVALSTPSLQTTAAQEATTLYAIQSKASQASFVINEVLRGSPKTVVGTTDQVAGEIALDPSNISTAQFGTILIDARTLTTDDDHRNEAIKNQILNTDQNEYISFTPTSVSGLPDSLDVGEIYTFDVTGDLTIEGVTHPATFEGTLTRNEDGSLQGNASATINYADWGLSIPSVPIVASVDNQVALKLDFTAVATA